MNITKEELYDLYVNKNKTDKEIGDLYGVTFGSVYTWRKKFGISGINAKHRKFFDKPQVPITPRQMSILIGTLLGDGGLKSQSASAYLSISHTIKQKEYIMWLYKELQSFCPTPPKEYLSKGKYVVSYFSSESRKDLKAIKDKIYVPKKTVNEWWANQIDELALAVWFMDDGCLSYVNKTKSEFSFATNSFSEKENYLLSDVIKKKFGINTSVRPFNKKSGMQYNIVINSDSFESFKNIISPYIIDSMSYKLPSEINNLHWQKNIKSAVDKKMLEKLYYDDLLTYDQIARMLDVHKCTVRKYMNLFGIKSRDHVSAQLRRTKNSCTRSKNGRFISLSLNKEQDKLAENIYEELRKGEFPYIKVKDDAHYIGAIDRMSNASINSIEDGAFAYSRTGMEICSALCPQVFSMAARGSLTPIEIFNDDYMLLDCIRRTIKYAKKGTIAAVRQGLKTYKNNRCVTIFPPSWGKTIIQYLMSNKKELSVLDFSCGFGGRLIGSYTSKLATRYVGIDPLLENINSHYAINKLLQKHAVLRNNTFVADFIHGEAEAVLPLMHEQFDIVITSPPYFSKEIYSQNETQCYNKYSDYESWKDKWLFPVINMAYNLLNVNGKMIIFASNIEKYPFGDDCNNIMGKIGMQNPLSFDFLLPSLEYFRSKKIRRVDSAIVISKIN